MQVIEVKETLTKITNYVEQSNVFQMICCILCGYIPAICIDYGLCVIMK